MKTFCTCNRKGGIGKTMTAYNLGAALIRKGYKVLFVDADSQANLTSYAGAKQGGLFEVLTGAADAKEVLQHGKHGEGILAGSEELAALELQKPAPASLRDALKKISRSFDFCIIDCPAQLGKITLLAMTASDALIIPAGNGCEDELQGVGKVLRPYYSVIENYNSKLTVAGVLVSDYDTRSKSLSRDMETNARNLCSAVGINCFKTVIRHRAALAKARLTKQSIFEYDPTDPAAEDFDNLAAELLSE